MTPLTYLAHLESQGDDAFVVKFADVPEAQTQGHDIKEAIEQAEDALAVALDGYLVEGREFPARTEPAAPKVAIVVEIPIRPVIAARWLLKQEMTRQNLSQVRLGRLMGRDEKTIRRIVAGKGASLDLVLKALAAIGTRPALAMVRPASMLSSAGPNPARGTFPPASPAGFV